ncbi:MAG TPA: alpha/beta fold hydrolase, partial [Actinomycetota bacterium]|nr:alpha/beta fold hydrolase [Actinomycetota bacterium]
GREAFAAPPEHVRAGVVILAAGALGSTEILLRSKVQGLSVSDRVGTRFSGNGDVLAFAYNAEHEVNGIGYGNRPPQEMEPVGPCITGIIDLRKDTKLEDGMVIEEGSIPGGMGTFLPGAFTFANEAVGRETGHGIRHRIEEKKQELTSLVEGAHHGAVRRSQTYLVMAHDSGSGTMELENDRLRVIWPKVGEEPIFGKIGENLEAATRPLGGTYLKDPVWTKVLKDRLVTVHPLGGCVMAEGADGGVVNHKGQVFSSEHGADVYEGLYVSDGSVVPRPIGVNPLLTISGLAERCVALMAADRGWSIDYSLPSLPQPAPAPQVVGVEFTERMAGWFSPGEIDDYEKGAVAGQAANSSLSFILTIVSEDMDSLINDPAHEAHMAGTVQAPALSATPLDATDGLFNLFIVDPDQPETRRMEYAMKLTSQEGREYYFTGFKIIRHDHGLADMWRDTTTLYVTIHDGPTRQSPELGKGVLKISPADFARQLTTMKATHAEGRLQGLQATARFGAFFAGILYETYGGVFAHTTYFNPAAPPRKKRSLRVDAPELHPFKTDDGVELLLTRYRGGAKGPVILAHGLGVSSKIFSTDLIDTNLLEFLSVHGYDVWLLDFRASIDLPASKERSTGDDIALHDYPAAVARILEATGAESIQALVHCYGATTFFMAMLAGLKGVRSAVASQIACNVVAPRLTKVKAGLHMPQVVDALGVESLTAYADANEDWPSSLFDKILKVDPVPRDEHCNSAVCHRITFLYSLLYEHAQLNELTHENLHELFGIANIDALAHLALMVRKGTVVRADGDDVYMPHLGRLAIPITFIHGERNDCYLPESTKLTYDLLRATNGNDLYQRHVIPGFGHIDCIFGRDAVRATYPLMLEALEAGNPP